MQEPSLGNGATHIQGGSLLDSLMLLGNSHRQTQKYFSVIVSNPVKVTLKISHHEHQTKMKLLHGLLHETFSSSEETYVSQSSSHGNAWHYPLMQRV